MSKNQHPFFEFKESAHRILSLFLSWIIWMVDYPRMLDYVKKTYFTSQYILPQPPASLSPKEEYIESRKTQFLASFENKLVDWNSNIEPVFSDANAFAELMKDPHNEIEQKWKKRILIENTPRGNVIMFYDAYKRGFSYYCDQAVMPYDIMNAVAMKYVLVFFCRDFFVDSVVLPKSAQKSEEKTEEKKDEKKNTVKTDKQAFAKFKTYNTATKKAGITEENDKVINCFLHLGASRNWSPIMKTAKPNPINGFHTDMVPSNRKLSYLDYKNMKG